MPAVLSELFNTVFVHVPKTAGQSIEHVFLDAHGLSWETRAALLMKRNDDPARGPKALAHLFAREFHECGHVTRERFERLFKFSIARNPYDRFISEYRWRRARKPKLTMQSLWAMKDGDPHSATARHLAAQTDFVLDEAGKVIVDKILKFETLSAELPQVFEHIFGRVPPWSPVNRSSGVPIAREALGDALKRQIHARYERDFDLFGYAREA